MPSRPIDYLESQAEKHERTIFLLEKQLNGVQVAIEKERAKLEAIREALESIKSLPTTP